MSIVVGTLTIDLKANTASFSQSMDKMSQLSAKSANDIKRSLEKIGTAAVALATGLAAATAALVETSISTIGSLSRLSQATGTTVEKFSALAYAARISHVEVDDMAKGMEKLAKSAFGAQNGNAGLQRIFGRLGVEVADSNHHLKDSSDLFSEVAVKFAGMANGAGKTALAMALFGKAGAAMIPLLNNLGKNQIQLTEEAKRFGLVIGGDVAAKAHQYHEVLTQLHAAQIGFGIQLTAAVLPALLKLSERLQDLGKDFDIPRLAQEFGTKLTAAINAAGVAFEFAVKHAHALKVALEALAGLQLAKIAIPLIADLAGGGLAKVGAGVAKLVIGFAGLGKVIPALAEFAGFLKTTVWMVGSLAAEEGIAAAAGYGLSTAVAAVGGPVTIAIAAVAGLTALLYKFRDATFGLGGTTYELRDIWNAAWIVMGNVFSWLGDTFGKVVTFMKSMWKSFMELVANNFIVQVFESVFSTVLAFARKMLGSLTPQFIIDALNKAKAQREAPAKKQVERPSPAQPELPQADTEGLGPTKKDKKKDLYGDEILKLNQLIQAQKAYLGVLGGTPEAIAKVAAQEKADTIILELNTKLLDEKRPALTNAEKATISYMVAVEENLKALNEYGKELVAQQHSADLSIQQTRALATANLEGEEAVRHATVANAMLALTYNRTADELKKMAPELAKVNALLTRKQNVDLVDATNKEIFALQHEIATKKIAVAAAGQFVDVERQAALVVKLYAINQQIATATDKEAIAALQQKRQLMIDLTKAEWAEEDAKAATALRSPIEKYQEEINQLNREVAAMKTAQGGNLTYAQSLQVAAREQDAFNKATDETVALLLRFGGIRDGVDAFFLDMEKSAKSAAAIIYEAFHSAFDKLSDQLTQLVTGGKTSFAQMFKDIGKQMVNSAIKAEMQKGIAAIGEKLGITLPGAGKPDGSKSRPWYVRMADEAGLGSPDDPGAPGGGAPSGDGGGGIVHQLLGAAGKIFGVPTGTSSTGKPDGTENNPYWVKEAKDSSGGSGLSGILGSLMSGGGGAAAGGGADAATSVTSSIEFGGMMASGGDMSPDKAYIVGDQGPEIRRGNRITSNSASRRMLEGNSSTHNYTIDARGTDPVLTEQRTRVAIMAAHNSAIRTSAQVQSEQVKRSPQR